MNQTFHDKIIELLPSKDLIERVKAVKFTFEEKELLKFIDDYAPNFIKKIELLKEAETAFSDESLKEHARKLIAYHEKDYADFMRADENCVYEIEIKCLPTDADEDTLLTKTFDGAIEMIKSWLQCYEDVGAKDNELSRYIIRKKTIVLPCDPNDISDGKVGTLGECFLGYQFKILDLYMQANRSEMLCDDSVPCYECKTPCIGMVMPRFPCFLKHYDLVAYYPDRLRRPTKIVYGILGSEMEDGDDDSFVVLLNNEYIKKRQIDVTDKNGYYEVFMIHEHPSYAELFKPNSGDVPQELYEDYLYAVDGLKRIDG